MFTAAGEMTCSRHKEDMLQCDRCGEEFCSECGFATHWDYPFAYCNDCVDKLDASDPTQNLGLLEILCNTDKNSLIARFGYDEFW